MAPAETGSRGEAARGCAVCRSPARSRRNAKGGIKDCQIKVIEGDTKSDPAVAATVARDLIGQGAQILLVPDDFDLGIAAARVGQKEGVLTLSTAASSTEFAKAVGDKFFNSGPTTQQLGTAQAKFALDKGWNNTYMVVDEGLAYFTEQVDAYNATIEGQGTGRGHRQGRLAERQVRLQLDGLEDQGGQPEARRDQRPDDLPADRVVREAAARRRHRHAGARQRDAADPRAAEARGRRRLQRDLLLGAGLLRGRGPGPEERSGDRSVRDRTTRPSSATSRSRPTARAPTRR